MNPRPADWDRLHDRLRQLWREEPRFARADLARVACPTTVYAAAHDEIIRLDHAKMLAASVAKGTFDLLDGASHFAMLQVPDAMARAIERHLVLVGDAKIVP